MTKRFKLSTDPAVVADQVDWFNANVALMMGATDYITSGDPLPAPKMQPQQHSSQSNVLAAAARKVKGLANGYKAIKSWSADGYPAIAEGLAEKRAGVCAGCPANQEGDFSSFVTLPFAERIKRDAEELSKRGLSTTQDNGLKICSKCDCPLRLKVHLPMDPYIVQTLTDELLGRLREIPNCWILAESGK
jgi:hypothetical protein